MINTKNYRIFVVLFPFSYDLNEGKTRFIHPKLKFDLLKGTPCPTRWLYDWILSVGWITIMRKSAQESETK